MLNTKKSPNANLEDKRLTYVLMGLVLAIAVFYVGIEWTDQEITVYEDTAISEEILFEEEIEQTIQEEPVAPPPPAPEPIVIEEIEIVEDDKETEEIDINSEDDENTAQEIIQAPIEMPEEDPDENVVFKRVEKMPEFPGGNQKLMEYLSREIRYPIIAQENGIQGAVIVQFTVRKDGKIDDVEVVRSADPSLDKEAIRLVKSMPDWNPGKQRGKAVHCKFTLPIRFRLQM